MAEMEAHNPTVFAENRQLAEFIHRSGICRVVVACGSRAVLALTKIWPSPPPWDFRHRPLLLFPLPPLPAR